MDSAAKIMMGLSFVLLWGYLVTMRQILGRVRVLIP